MKHIAHFIVVHYSEGAREEFFDLRFLMFHPSLPSTYFVIVL